MLLKFDSSDQVIWVHYKIFLRQVLYLTLLFKIIYSWNTFSTWKIIFVNEFYKMYLFFSISSPDSVLIPAFLNPFIRLKKVDIEIRILPVLPTYSHLFQTIFKLTIHSAGRVSSYLISKFNCIGTRKSRGYTSYDHN